MVCFKNPLPYIVKKMRKSIKLQLATKETSGVFNKNTVISKIAKNVGKARQVADDT